MSKSAWAQLICLGGDYSSFSITESSTLIGRGPQCSIQLSEEVVSQMHAVIKKEDDGLVFIHDRSSNGTFVQGITHSTLIQKDKLRIEDGDYITFGGNSPQTKVALTFAFSLVDTEVRQPELEHYSIEEVLGDGTFSVVRRGRDLRTGEQVAVKIVDKAKVGSIGGLAHFERETAILKEISHPNIVTYKDLFDSKQWLYMVLELAEGGELFSLVQQGPLEEHYCREIFRQILVGVDYLHSRNVIHRDLKLENVLFVDKEMTRIKISDFGFSKFVPEKTLTHTLVGTPEYLAPEVVGKNDGYGREVDMWCLGIMLYIMLCGYPPFRRPRSEDLKFGDGWEDVSEEAKDLVRNLLVVDRSLRLNTTQSLQHPWMHNKRSLSNDSDDEEIEQQQNSKRQRTSEQ